MQDLSLQTVLVLLLTPCCAFTDWRQGKVYNVLTYPFALLGIALHIFAPPPGLLMSVAGLVGCLLFFGVLWYVGVLGAGDVKLLMAIGALKGLSFVIHVSFYTICTATVVGLFLLVWQCRLWPVSKWVALKLVSIIIPVVPVPRLQGEKTVMPFAPFIFMGTLIAAYLEIVRGLSADPLGLLVLVPIPLMKVCS